ncbi:hypothetical protein C8J56DRAFT_334925 [Mycena floridula]|nr:hypothetical protein C8J56DRAFT_334925 [Mycena floridula]
MSELVRLSRGRCTIYPDFWRQLRTAMADSSLFSLVKTQNISSGITWLTSLQDVLSSGPDYVSNFFCSVGQAYLAERPLDWMSVNHSFKSPIASRLVDKYIKRLLIFCGHEMPTSDSPPASAPPKLAQDDSVLQRPRNYKLPLPRFENDPPVPKSPKRASYSSRATTIPAILLQLKEKYSSDLVRLVEPSIMPAILPGQGAYLTEPYSVTLKQAVKDGRISKEQLKQLSARRRRSAPEPRQGPSPNRHPSEPLFLYLVQISH